MVYTANWGIICHLPPFRGTRNNHWINGWKMNFLLGFWPTFRGDVRFRECSPKSKNSWILVINSWTPWRFGMFWKLSFLEVSCEDRVLPPSVSNAHPLAIGISFEDMTFFFAKNIQCKKIQAYHSLPYSNPPKLPNSRRHLWVGWPPLRIRGWLRGVNQAIF